MAEVYRAYHANLDRYVAIKILHAFLAEDQEFQVRFEKEARNIAKLRHPHIVQVYDFDYDEKRESYYMVMELVNGVTLKDRLADLAEQDEKLSIAETLRIIKEAADALAYAHNRGMIHRDVKPANLMLDHDDRVVLTDFGIAKMLDSKQMTVSGGMIGTPAYMSPEQGLGEPGDERSDLYSLGVIKYQLLVGALPYDAETALGVILMHVNDPIPDVSAINQSVPKPVRAIVERAMAKDPEQRYQTAEQVIEDIERAGRGEDVSPMPARQDDPPPAITDLMVGHNGSAMATAENSAVSVSTPEKQQSRSGRSMVWLALVLGVVMLVGGGYFFGVQAEVIPPIISLAGADATATPTVTESPTITPTPTVSPTNTPDLLGSATAVAMAVQSQTVAAPTETPTDTPSATPTSTPMVEPTATPTEDLPPTETPNVTQTAAVQQTATTEACEFDYAVVEQIPADGEAGGFFRVGEPYLREITLLNTGTCEWGDNTSLTFVRGEDFDAGPRIFVRESVRVGEELTIMFEGTAPARGSVDPIIGTWQLRTRGQRPIGAPIDISVMVFDPGT